MREIHPDRTIRRSTDGGVEFKFTKAPDAGIPTNFGDPDVERKMTYQFLCDDVRDLMRAGRFAEAKPNAEAIVAMARELAGAESSETAIGLRNLAWICHETDDPRAGPLYEEAVAICEEKLGLEHKRTVRYRSEMRDYFDRVSSSTVDRNRQGDLPRKTPFLGEAHAVLCRFVGRALHTESYGDLSQSVPGPEAAWFIERGTHMAYFIMQVNKGWEARLLARSGENMKDTEDLIWIMEGSTRTIWSTVEDEACETTRKVIATFVSGTSEADLRFSHRVWEEMDENAEPKVVRKAFESPQGVITAHTMRVEGGTRIVLEVASNGNCLDLFHDALTHEMRLVRVLQTRPF